MHMFAECTNRNLENASSFQWFDLTCGPKIIPNYKPQTPEDPQTADPGPVVMWEDGKKYSFNVYPLCGVFREDIPFEI